MQTMRSPRPLESFVNMKIFLSLLLLVGLIAPSVGSAQTTNPFQGGGCFVDADCNPFEQCVAGECQNLGSATSNRGDGPNTPGGPSGGDGGDDGPNTPRGAGGSGGGSTAELINPLQADSLEEFFEAILGFIVRIGTILVVVMIVIVGFMFVSARGNPEKLKEARTALLWTLVGAIILIGASIIAEAIRATVEAISS